MSEHPPADLILRPFAAVDQPVLQAIRHAAFAPVFQSFRDIVGKEIADIALCTAESEQAKHLDDICASQSDHHLLVATLRDEIVGFVSFTVDATQRVGQRTGEIGLNAVHPDHAGKGIGTWMYEKVLGRMKDMGVAVATVGTGGDSSHVPARRAYEKAGFGPAIPSVYLYRLL